MMIAVKRVITGICFTFFIICLVAQNDRSYARADEVVVTVVHSNDRTQSGTEQYTPRACPDDMVEIQGEYCPTVKQNCLKWRDNKEGERCEEWGRKVTCTSMPVNKHYCIDTYEYPNKKGEIPRDWMSWNDMKKACEAGGKRLCTRSEWTFAAEGPNKHPYPYGDGYHRDNTICNFDKHVATVGITGDQVMTVADPQSEVAEKLRSLLVPSGSLAECVSEWGVHDMSGNIDEWVQNEGHVYPDKAPYISGLMGGHVFGVRNASRPITDAHAPWFKWYETGGRCCEDAQ